MFNAQQFAARLAAREDRWSLLTDFVAKWRRPLQEGDGYSATELDAAEQRLGLKLPLALREWYQLTGLREDIVAPQNFLVSPVELEISEENGLLVFHSENQQVVEWGIQTSDLDLVDPPVWLDNSGLHDAQQEPIRENNTLSEFALQMVVLETLFSSEVFEGYGKVNPLTLRGLEQHFIHVGFPDWHWPTYPTRFYGGDDVLIQTFGNEALQVTTRSRTAFEQVKTVLGIDWDHHP